MFDSFMEDDACIADYCRFCGVYCCGSCGGCKCGGCECPEDYDSLFRVEYNEEDDDE